MQRCRRGSSIWNTIVQWFLERCLVERSLAKILDTSCSHGMVPSWKAPIETWIQPVPVEWCLVEWVLTKYPNCLSNTRSLCIGWFGIGQEHLEGWCCAKSIIFCNNPSCKHYWNGIKYKRMVHTSKSLVEKLHHPQLQSPHIEFDLANISKDDYCQEQRQAQYSIMRILVARANINSHIPTLFKGVTSGVTPCVDCDMFLLKKKKWPAFTPFWSIPM